MIGLACCVSSKRREQKKLPPSIASKLEAAGNRVSNRALPRPSWVKSEPVLVQIQMVMTAIPTTGLVCDPYVELSIYLLEDDLADAYSGWDLTIECPRQMRYLLVEANLIGYECSVIQFPTMSDGRLGKLTKKEDYDHVHR